jgi:hypothetical protein
MTDLPNFTAWPSSRIAFLLKEYQSILKLDRIEPESHALYSSWVRALEQELERRARV